jgi:hypothetical protein
MADRRLPPSPSRARSRSSCPGRAWRWGRCWRLARSAAAAPPRAKLPTPSSPTTTSGRARPLAPGRALKARILDSDPDYYDLTGFASRACSLSFEPVQSDEAIEISALDADGDELARAETRSLAGALTAALDLSELEATTLLVKALKDGGRCLTYDLRCTQR